MGPIRTEEGCQNHKKHQNPENPFGSHGNLFEYISCWKAPNGNRDESYLTFYSPGETLIII